jgi:hypothetical protein
MLERLLQKPDAGRRTTSVLAISVQRAAAWGAGTGLALFVLRQPALPAMATPVWVLLLIASCGAALGAATGAGLLTVAQRRLHEFSPAVGSVRLSPANA